MRKNGLKNNLPFTVGFELTAVHKAFTQKDYEELRSKNDKRLKKDGSKLEEKLSKKYRHVLKAKAGYPGKLADGHCLEIPSPVCKTVNKVVEFYRDVWNIIKPWGYQPQHSHTVCGGNHWHFGIKDIRTIRALARDLFNRYYIPWVFTQPDDTDSCNNLISHPNVTNVTGIFFPTNDVKFIYRGCDNFILYLLLSDKRIPIKIRISNKEHCFSVGNQAQTFEFRCAEAPKDESELLDQLEFFVKYVAFVKKQMKKGLIKMPTSFMTNEQFQAITPHEAAGQFYHLLGQLGLSIERYEKYVKRNLYPRWELERERS